MTVVERGTFCMIVSLLSYILFLQTTTSGLVINPHVDQYTTSNDTKVDKGAASKTAGESATSNQKLTHDGVQTQATDKLSKGIKVDTSDKSKFITKGQKNQGCNEGVASKPALSKKNPSQSKNNGQPITTRKGSTNGKDLTTGGEGVASNTYNSPIAADRPNDQRSLDIHTQDQEPLNTHSMDHQQFNAQFHDQQSLNSHDAIHQPLDRHAQDQLPLDAYTHDQQHFNQGPLDRLHDEQRPFDPHTQGQRLFEQLVRDANNRFSHDLHDQQPFDQRELHPFDAFPPLRQFNDHFRQDSRPQNQRQYNQHHHGDHNHGHRLHGEYLQMEPSTQDKTSGTVAKTEPSLRKKKRIQNSGRPVIKKDMRFANIPVEALKAHNDARRRVQPAAANMLKMVWNEELAAIAEAYAKQCKLFHNKNRNNGNNSFIYIGENLFMSYPLDNITIAIKDWEDEDKLYNFTSNSCSGVCGHYTQVVWHDTDEVGCGISICPITKRKLQAIVVVCNYGPGGNINGNRPYEAGRPCSKCPPGTTCEDGLCSRTSTNP